MRSRRGCWCCCYCCCYWKCRDCWGEITAGGQPVSSVTGGLKVEIPADCGPGTVAQMVDENGNVLSTLRKSYASGQTMNVPLEGSAKVIFVDNGKSFADVPAGNWAANAVAFASGHELMNGVAVISTETVPPVFSAAMVTSWPPRLARPLLEMVMLAAAVSTPSPPATSS